MKVLWIENGTRMADFTTFADTPAAVCQREFLCYDDYIYFFADSTCY